MLLPRRIKSTTELRLGITAPRPDVTLLSDGEGVVVTGGYGGDVRREVWDRAGLVGVGAQAHGGRWEPESALGRVSEAHHCRQPSAGRAGSEG